MVLVFAATYFVGGSYHKMAALTTYLKAGAGNLTFVYAATRAVWEEVTSIKLHIHCTCKQVIP